MTPTAGMVTLNRADAAGVTGRLLYVRAGSIEEISSSGSHELAKATAATGDFMNPAWSPDGKRIAYAVRQKDYSDIGVMSADGSNQTALTHDQNSVVQDNLWAAMPAWSPDGASLLFSSDRGKQEPNIDVRLWLLTLTSREFQQVSTPDLQAGGDADAQFRPGHPGQVVYTKWAYDASATATYATLVLHDMTSNTDVVLTSPKETDFQPAWSPDGKVLAFIRRGPGADELYAAPVPDTLPAGATLQATLLEAGVNAQPEWSPAGDAIAYIAQADNQFDLYTLAVTTAPTLAANGKPQRLTSDGIDATSRPSWTR
jgi:Tol biopolymer transport system component